MEVYRLVFAGPRADGAFFALEEEAAVGVYVRDQRDRLRKVNMAGFVQGQVLIILVRDLDRAVFGTGRTTPALLSSDVPGLFDEGDLDTELDGEIDDDLNDEQDGQESTTAELVQ